MADLGLKSSQEPLRRLAKATRKSRVKAIAFPYQQDLKPQSLYGLYVLVVKARL